VQAIFQRIKNAGKQLQQVKAAVNYKINRPELNDRVKVLRYAGRGYWCYYYTVTLSLSKGLTSAKVVKFLICANGLFKI
jgi:hypothetical protein